MVLIHSKLGLADPELLPSIRREANQVLLEKGVELVLGEFTPAGDCSRQLGVWLTFHRRVFRTESEQLVGAAAEHDDEEHGGDHGPRRNAGHGSDHLLHRAQDQLCSLQRHLQ